MYKIAAENLQALFQKIAADQDLYLPVKVSDQVNFKAWSEDAEVCLDTLKTVKSPKDAFFPQSENLYTCKKEEKNISIEPQALQEKNFVVFGMKACDIQGVKVLDNVFLSDPIDTFYASRLSTALGILPKRSNSSSFISSRSFMVSIPAIRL